MEKLDQYHLSMAKIIDNLFSWQATLPKRYAVDTRVTDMVRTGTPMTKTSIIKDVS